MLLQFIETCGVFVHARYAVKCLGQPPIPHVDMILGHLPTMYFVMFALSLSNSTAGDSEMKVKN